MITLVTIDRKQTSGTSRKSRNTRKTRLPPPLIGGGGKSMGEVVKVENTHKKGPTLFALCFVIKAIPQEWANCDKQILGTKDRWQLMPVTDQTGDAPWDWLISNRRRWFEQKSTAITQLLCAWLEWTEINYQCTA